jgi:hypothetical protein
MTFDGTCERGEVQRAPQGIEERSPESTVAHPWDAGSREWAAQQGGHTGPNAGASLTERAAATHR